MGNCICCKEKKQKKINSNDPNIPDPKDFKFDLSGVNILIKIGDITKEKADAIVSGTDNFAKNRSESFLNSPTIESLNNAITEKRRVDVNEPLLNGEIIITKSPGNFKNVKYVIHIAVPLWRGGDFDEIEKLKQGFADILKQATKAKIRSIIFTDVAGSLFGFPRQYTAQTLMEVIHDYADNYKSPNKIKKIKFVHKEPQTVLIFQDYLKQETLYNTQRSNLDYIDHRHQQKVCSDQKDQNSIDTCEFSINKDTPKDQETKQSTENTST